MPLWHMVMASFDTWLGHFWQSTFSFDLETEKSPMRTIARGLKNTIIFVICVWGEWNFQSYSGRTKADEKTIVASMLIASCKDEVEH